MIFLVLLFLTGICSAQVDSIETIFHYSDPNAKSISIAGSFNSWNADINKFTSDGNGLWNLKLKLAPAWYYYKIVADGNWIPDPRNPNKIFDGGSSFNSIIKVGTPPVPIRKKSERPFDKAIVPEPILSDNPEYIDLYYAAWQMAWNKISSGTTENGFADSYMDEGFNELIYQWDTNFIVAFAMYAADEFPVMASLDNFYSKQRYDGYIQRVYWESNGTPANKETPDEPMVNPPLFAWMELRYYHLTGDSSRLNKVLPVLIKYFKWIEKNCESKYQSDLYYNTPLGSGMDNTPRYEVEKSGWIDMSAQQALAAKCISEIAMSLNIKNIQEEFNAKYKLITGNINKYNYDNKKHFYFDVRTNNQPAKTKHIGAFWTMLAEVCDSSQAAGLVSHLIDPDEFWRPNPVPALAADEPEYNAAGFYWRGGVWAPTNYMVIKGLEKYGFQQLADQIAKKQIENMVHIYKSFAPEEDKIAYEERFNDGYHTIWECYSPEFPKPATRWDSTFYSRQDFVGWSGLGPIALLIENILGINISGYENKITWRINRSDEHGIKNVNLAGQKVSLIASPNNAGFDLSIKCDKPFTLEVIHKNKSVTYSIPAGGKTISIY